MANALTKINKEAKRLQRLHGGSYAKAQKTAGKKYRDGKLGKVRKKKATRKASSPSKPRRKPRPASTPRARAPRISGIEGMTAAQSEALARRKIKEQLGWLMATKATARTQREKKALQPRINEYTKKLKALS